MTFVVGLLQSSQFLQFAYLQTLDLLSTAAFLLQGVEEGNPVVRLAMGISSNPVYGLALTKVVALGLGVLTLKVGKVTLLEKINWGYAALVAWNLGCLVMASR